MPTVWKLLGKLALWAGLLGLAACSAPTPTPAPTQDLNLLRTEVAATVLAQVPELCALTPTITPTPTDTPTPTETPTPTATGATATATQGTPAASGGNRAKWVSQSVEDGTRFNPGQSFEMTWRLQNTGVTTWNANYRLRHWAGERFGAPAEVLIGRDVAPGETIDIAIQMKAPANAGEYRSDWVMANELRGNFNEPVYLKILVVGAGTPAAASATSAVTVTTVAPTETQTATSTMTPTP